jgi:hypothetical protein
VPIIKFPSVPGGYINRIDQESRKAKSGLRTDFVDLSAGAMSFKVFNLVERWRVDNISMSFSSSTSRDFAVNLKSGFGIVDKANDAFWLGHTNVAAQYIVLDSGFYDNSAAFCAHVKSKLDNNQAFSGAGVTFAVSYSTSTRLFTIASSSGQIKFYYLNTGSSAHIPSLAAPVLGFMTDVGFASSISSTTPVDIGTTYAIYDGSSSTATSFVDTDIKHMNLDRALEITADTGPSVSVTAQVDYTLL